MKNKFKFTYIHLLILLVLIFLINISCKDRRRIDKLTSKEGKTWLLLTNGRTNFTKLKYTYGIKLFNDNQGYWIMFDKQQQTQKQIDIYCNDCDDYRHNKAFFTWHLKDDSLIVGIARYKIMHLDIDSMALSHSGISIFKSMIQL